MIHGHYVIRSLLSCLWLAAAHPALAQDCFSTTKLVGHLVPAQTAGTQCQYSTPLYCHDQAHPIVDTGDVGVPYTLYLLAFEDTFLNISFGIHYDGVEDSGLEVLGWTRCAVYESPENGWPADGSGITLSYIGCAGTEPDPLGSGGQPRVLLGALEVIARDPDVFAIGEMDYRDDPRIRELSCSGTERWVWVNGGQVAFGQPNSAIQPCADYIDLLPGVCCTPDSCVADTYGPCCTQLGGTFFALETCTTCPTPAGSSTWGRIKSLIRE